MDKEDENIFPNYSNVEDLIFINCMNRIKEFPQYITNISETFKKYDSRYASDSAYKNLNLDSVRQKEDGSLIDIEHHSSITPQLLARNNEYCAVVHSATGKLVQPYIFYTGKLPVVKIHDLNDVMKFIPTWLISQEIDGRTRLNNIKYKICKHESLNVFDIIDLIWLPTYHMNINRPDIVLNLTKLSKEINCSPFLFDVFRYSLILWVGKYIHDKEKLKEIRRDLNMTKLETVPLGEALKNVVIKARLERAEKYGFEKGHDKGFDEGRNQGFDEGRDVGSNMMEEKFVKLLLNDNDLEYISSTYDVPLERVLEISKLDG